MKKRYYIIIILLILAINFAVVWIAKNKFSHITQNIVSESNYYSMPANYNEFPEYTNFKNLDDLENESELILKIEVTKEKEYIQEDTLTPVDIKEVIKGNASTDIKIAEPFNINNYNTNANVYGGYIPLVPEKEYIVYLNSTNLKDVYKYTSVEFGHFALDKKSASIYDYSNNTTKKVKDLIEYDFLYIYNDSDNKIETIDNAGKISSIDMFDLKSTYIKLKEECLYKYSEE